MVILEVKVVEVVEVEVVEVVEWEMALVKTSFRRQRSQALHGRLARPAGWRRVDPFHGMGLLMWMREALLRGGSEDDISYWGFLLVGFSSCGFGIVIASATAIAIAFEENEI